jgi:deoxyribodipyrimidine photolyase-related protein
MGDGAQRLCHGHDVGLGVIFAIKPNICGSSYSLKIGDLKRGPWCEIWDGHCWCLIDRHRAFLRRDGWIAKAEASLERTTRVVP